MWDLEPVASLELDNLLQRQFPVPERPFDPLRWALGPQLLHAGPQRLFAPGPGGLWHYLFYSFVTKVLPLILAGSKHHGMVLSS